jgi:nucleoid-associated protein YgaU
VVWPRQHQVKPGDTLRSIAEYYYHDAGLWEQIYEANRDKVERGLPREGAVLTIPQPLH